MITIRFTAKAVGQKPEHSTEDVNAYEVRYTPTRGSVRGSGGSFSNLLLEAICGLPEHNLDKRAVRVEMSGEFPEKYINETKRLVDFYSRAENINAGVYTE